jgi:aspartate/methionine/tyrosine aminotransferase
MNQHFADRVQTLRPTAVNRVLAEAKSDHSTKRPLVSLMRGQPDSATPPHIVAAANDALARGHTGYPDNQGEMFLRQAVARKLIRDNGLSYDPIREVLITDGATGGLFAALAALLNPGDDVLVPDPVYDAYVSPIAIWGGRAVPVRARIESGRFVMDRAALEAAHTARTRVLLINTPWNPTGSVFTHAELSVLMDFAREHDLRVLSDEIYETLIYDGRRHVSPASVSEDARSRTVLVHSLSKTYAMTGWRVGYCAAPADIVASMLLVWQQFSRGPATFVQHAAAAALEGDQACVRAMAAEYEARRDRVVSAIQGIPGVAALVPEGGLFVMADVRGLGISSNEVRADLLREEGLIVIHGAAYGPGGEGTLRISFAGGGAALDEGLRRLRIGLLRLSSLSCESAKPS